MFAFERHLFLYFIVTSALFLPCGGCKTESLKKAQHEKIENVAGSV
jgi:hypothetical protein